MKIKDWVLEQQEKDFDDSDYKPEVDITKEVRYNEKTMQIENVESAEEKSTTPSAGDEEVNMVTCMRCGEEIEQEVSYGITVGDESVELCEYCNDDMRG